MRFTSMHWSLQGWSEMAEAAGFVIDAIREVGSPDPEDRWHRIPLFLHLRLRASGLGADHVTAWPEWEEGGDADLWDRTVGDGVGG